MLTTTDQKLIYKTKRQLEGADIHCSVGTRKYPYLCETIYLKLSLLYELKHFKNWRNRVNQFIGVEYLMTSAVD